MQKKLRRNEQITAKTVRLVNAEGEQLVVTLDKALREAAEARLDLVEVVPASENQPAVCKLMDYSKKRYQDKKKSSESKKKQTRIKVKEVKLRVVTDEGDIQVKLRNLRRFLESGDKAKVTIWFRGREIVTQKDMALGLMTRLYGELDDIAAMELAPKLEGRQMIMILVPRKKI